MEVVKLKIQEGDSKSIEDKENPVPDAVLKPEIVEGKITAVELVPVEVIKLTEIEPGSTFEPSIVIAKSLNISKMEHSLDDQGMLHLTDTDMAHRDPDLFFVRLPIAAPELAPVKVKVSTTRKGGGTLDGADEITLTYNDEKGVFVSKSMLLVSDKVDDNYAENGVGTNDAPEDRTHWAEVGGTLALTNINVDGTDHSIDVKIPIEQKKTLTVHAVVFTDSGITGGEVKSILETQVRERFSQTGVRVEVGNITDVAPPSIPGRLANSEMAIYHSPLNSNGLSDEGFWMIEAGRGVLTATSSEIYVFFCKRVKQYQMGTPIDYYGYAWSSMKVGSYPSIYALRPDSANNVRTVNPAHYANNCFINVGRALGRPFTVSHEIGHLLTNAGHFDDYPPGNSATSAKKEQNLMRAGTSETNTITASKRFQQFQQEAIHGHPATK